MTHADRPQIDGLRSVAVVFVVLFYAGATGRPGGFMGVDVCFVISGYLITRILQQDIDQDRFARLTFCDRRVGRSRPALHADRQGRLLEVAAQRLRAKAVSNG